MVKTEDLKKEDVNEAMKKRSLKQNKTSHNNVKKSTQTVTKKYAVKPK